MEKVTVEMIWEVPNECTPEQKNQLRNMVDSFMNDVAEEFAWNEEMFSIEKEKEGNKK